MISNGFLRCMLTFCCALAVVLALVGTGRLYGVLTSAAEECYFWKGLTLRVCALLLPLVTLILVWLLICWVLLLCSLVLRSLYGPKRLRDILEPLTCQRQSRQIAAER